jgi:ABC-2 type transport system ATP-binding protein
MDKENLIIDVNNLSKRFAGKPAVIDVSLQVKRGEIFGFLGPNGSGKTTTIRMLCGLLTPDTGYGTCMGYDILKDTKLIKQHVGYIPQFFGLYKQLTIYENLLLIAELYGVVNRNKKVKQVMDQLDLNLRRHQIAGSLSGGWKQRLALAAALVHDPFLLLLDEPTASVDPKSRRDFWQVMHSLAAEGLTILLSSHNMDEVERCHRIAYICNGQLLLCGQIKEIINDIELITWQVSGKNLILLAHQLEATPGIEQVMTFYDTLHISGQDKQVLETALVPYMANPHYTWKKIQPTLEDAFIWLSRDASIDTRL